MPLTASRRRLPSSSVLVSVSGNSEVVLHGRCRSFSGALRGMRRCRGCWVAVGDADCPTGVTVAAGQLPHLRVRRALIALDVNVRARCL
jgi:hypothetical protein